MNGCHQRHAAARTLAGALWFSALSASGFLVLLMLPFLAPSPRQVPVAVVGQPEAASISEGWALAVPSALTTSGSADASAA